MALLTLAHERSDGAGDIEETLDVSVNHALPVLEEAVLDRIQSDCETCVVDQDVDVAPFAFERSDCRLDLGIVADVEVQSDDVRFVSDCEEFLEFLETVGAASCDDEVVASVGESD